MSATAVPVWDPLVRVFHWSLAFAFLGTYFLTEGGDPWHEWVGYFAAAWLVVRFAWGFAGRGAARWADFWPTPSRVAAHVRALVRGEPHHRLGHSALGAVVMILMMLGVAALAITGYLMEEIDYFWGDERLHVLHDYLADGVLALAVVHVFAALFESVRLRENLPWSMVTGRRRPLR